MVKVCKIKAMVLSLVENASEEILLHIARNCGFNDEINTENYQDLILELNLMVNL
jgi:hypothetical protein